MTEQFIVFKRGGDGMVRYLDERNNLTTELGLANRFPYYSDAKRVATKYAMLVREI